MTTTARTKAATTDEELRQQAYNLIASRDIASDPTTKRDGKFWGNIKKHTIEVLTKRGTPENLGIAETVESVLKSYRAKSAQ